MGFLIPAGTNSGTSPDEITRKRQLAQALLGDALKPEEMRSPLQGVGDLGEAFVSALLNRRANSQERTGKEGANSLIAQILAGNKASAGAPSSPMASGGTPGAAPDIAQQIMAMGYSPTAASGIVGNLMHESNLNPTAVGDGGTSYGLAQWHNERKAGLDQYAKELGGNPVDVPMQLAYLQKELQGPESGVRDALQQARTPEEAATAFMGFERPQGYSPDNPQGGLGYDARVKNAGDVAAQLGGGPSPQGGQDNGALVAALLGNEYIDPNVKSMLFSRLNPEPKPLMDIGAGATVFDPNSNKPVYTAPGQSGTVVNVGDNGVKFPPPESGYDYIRNPDGTVKVGDNGLPTLAAIPGGKPATEAAAAEDKTAAGQQQKEKYADVVTQDIDRAVEAIGKAPNTTTGFGAQALSGIGGTASHNVSELISGVKANVTFDRLQEMRAASPTGGALGQVSDFENRLMSSTLGSLEQSQSKDQLLFNLKRVRTIYDKIINEGIKPGDPILTEMDAAPQGGPQPGAVESDEKGNNYRFKGGDPADPKNWEPVT